MSFADETVPQRSEKKKEAANTGKTKSKKAPENKWIPKNEKQAYSHPWLLTSIKGHTGPILDIDFSSNGKFLASCADGKWQALLRKFLDVGMVRKKETFLTKV